MYCEWFLSGKLFLLLLSFNSKQMNSSPYNRRVFIKQSLMAGSLLAFRGTNVLQAFAAEKKTRVRIGMIAVGLRGQSHLEEMLKRADVDVIAMADPDKNMMAMAQGVVKK